MVPFTSNSTLPRQPRVLLRRRDVEDLAVDDVDGLEGMIFADDEAGKRKSVVIFIVFIVSISCVSL